MIYTQEIQIDLSRKKVLEIFDNPENMKHWQTGLQGYEHFSGIPGEVGSKMRLDFLVGKRRIELTETITKREFPEKFEGKYEWGGGWNTLKNQFIELGENKTVWISETEMHMKGMMKLIGWIMPGSFKKNSYKFMENFKAFAEANMN